MIKKEQDNKMNQLHLPMNVVIDFNENYYLPTMTMLWSLRKNTPKSISLRCFVLQYVDSKFVVKLNDIKHFLFSNDSVEVIKVPHIFTNHDFGRWNDMIALRIIGIYYLPHDVKQFVRFDGDVVINGSILPFYNHKQINESVVIGTKEFVPWLKDKPIYLYLNGGDYINSGSLVINVLNWKKKYPAIADLITAVNNIPFKLTAWDQDIINYLFPKDKYVLPDDQYMRFCDDYLYIDKFYKSKNPIVYHYAGNHKPWFTKGNPRYRHFWWKYAKKVYPSSKKIKMHFNRTAYILMYPFRLFKKMI